MAGGFGSRLYPLTVARPKPMIPLINKPVLAHILNLLKRHGFSDVVITVRYLASQIQEYFGDGTQYGLTIHYGEEEAPLGTAGGVKNAQHFLDDQPFLVISGDALTDINLTKLIQFHRERRALATMALKEVKKPCEYGVVLTARDGRITHYYEKPDCEQAASHTVNTGIYVLEPEVLNALQTNTTYDFSNDVFPRFLQDNARFFGHKARGYWRDIGTIHSYMEATADALTGKINVIDPKYYRGSGIWTGEDVRIAPSANLFGPIYLGDGVRIKPGATIYGPTVICDQTIVDQWARIERAIVCQNCYIGKSVKVQNTIIPQNSTLTAPVAAHFPAITPQSGVPAG